MLPALIGRRSTPADSSQRRAKRCGDASPAAARPLLNVAAMPDRAEG